MDVKIIKGIEYREIINSIKDELSIQSDFSIYIGEDANDYYKLIGGTQYINDGLYDNDLKIIFIKTIDETVFFHEFTHIKFRELYNEFNGDEAVLHFINEYIVVLTEHKMLIDMYKDEEDYHIIKEVIINEIFSMIDKVREEIEINKVKLKKDYMYNIANLLARKHILLNLNHNIEIDKSYGLNIFKSFNGLNINNVKEKYSDIENEYLKYINKFNIIA